MHAASSSPSSIPATLDGYDLLRAAEICLGDLLVPVGARPARTDWALVLPSDTYLIGHRTTPEGLSPARLFHVYRAHPAPAPAPAPAPGPASASYPSTNYTPSPVPSTTATQLAQAALHLACALQLLAGLQARSPSATPVPAPRDGGAA